MLNKQEAERSVEYARENHGVAQADLETILSFLQSINAPRLFKKESAVFAHLMVKVLHVKTSTDIENIAASSQCSLRDVVLSLLPDDLAFDSLKQNIEQMETDTFRLALGAEKFTNYYEYVPVSHRPIDTALADAPTDVGGAANTSLSSARNWKAIRFLAFSMVRLILNWSYTSNVTAQCC